MGGIDYLVLNHITDSNFGLWQSHKSYDFITNMFTINTFSYIWMANAALSYLLQSKGHIVVVSSVAGKIGIPNTTIYSATKHALHGFFNGLRNELTHFSGDNNQNISITLCIIGATATEGAKVAQEKLTKVDWIDPALVAKAIVNGAALRLREITYPYSSLPVIVMNTFVPAVVDYLLYLFQS